MPKRNYKKETNWKRQHYHRFNADLPIEHAPACEAIKNKFGNTKWLIKAIGVYQDKPELWEEDKDGSNENHL